MAVEVNPIDLKLFFFINLVLDLLPRCWPDPAVNTSPVRGKKSKARTRFGQDTFC